MERKAKVTQEIVNEACSKLLEDGKNITVNAVINDCGGSFSTVGRMVKLWKEQLAAQATSIIEIPESVSEAMQKAAADIWETASRLAGETVERIQKETAEAISKAKNELSEYAGEVSRLEAELEVLNGKLSQKEQELTNSTSRITELTAQNTALETRLDDRDKVLERAQANYEKLQTELIEIAKLRSDEKTNNKKKPEK